MSGMIQIDENLLNELGLSDLSTDEKNDALEVITNSLQERVGDRAIDSLDDGQVEQLENSMVNDTAEETQQWLISNVPDYEAITAEEFDKIKQQVREQGIHSLASDLSNEA